MTRRVEDIGLGATFKGPGLPRFPVADFDRRGEHCCRELCPRCSIRGTSSSCSASGGIAALVAGIISAHERDKPAELHHQARAGASAHRRRGRALDLHDLRRRRSSALSSPLHRMRAAGHLPVTRSPASPISLGTDRPPVSGSCIASPWVHGSPGRSGFPHTCSSCMAIIRSLSVSALLYVYTATFSSYSRTPTVRSPDRRRASLAVVELPAAFSSGAKVDRTDDQRQSDHPPSAISARTTSLGSHPTNDRTSRPNAAKDPGLIYAPGYERAAVATGLDLRYRRGPAAPNDRALDDRGVIGPAVGAGLADCRHRSRSGFHRAVIEGRLGLRIDRQDAPLADGGSARCAVQPRLSPRRERPRSRPRSRSR